MTTVSSGQNLYVSSGQTSSGVVLYVLSGGTASGTTVSSGGALDVLSGGFADPTTIFGGGSEVVSAGGEDVGALISGGTQYDYGTATSTTINAGGLVSLIDSFGEQLSQVFMLRVFDVDTNC